MQTLRSMAVLQVRSVARSVAFYEALGFASHGGWGDPPLFAIVQRGDVTIALDKARADDPIPLNQWWAVYIYVDDAKALREEFATLELRQPTEMHFPQHYGCIDFDVVDPDGHRIAFGQSLHPVPGPGLNEDRGRG
jgi:catechol 2,3-dioxygenase-like lactoylglutathione lyase family enzyme